MFQLLDPTLRLSAGFLGATPSAATRIRARTTFVEYVYYYCRVVAKEEEKASQLVGFKGRIYAFVAGRGRLFLFLEIEDWVFRLLLFLLLLMLCFVEYMKEGLCSRLSFFLFLSLLRVSKVF